MNLSPTTINILSLLKTKKIIRLKNIQSSTRSKKVFDELINIKQENIKTYLCDNEIIIVDLNQPFPDTYFV